MYMLANNNRQVITRMALRSIKSNRRRSAIIIGAIMLSTFMVFTVLTVGMTYFKMQRLQNLRMDGAEFDAIVYGITDEQRRICEEHPDIKVTGIAAVLGGVEETKEDQTPNVGLVWADETAWNQMMEPAREWVKGEYPQEVDEIMVSKAALKECGMEQLEVGDSLAFTYRYNQGEHTKEFRISGMWDGFGPKKVFYMSKAFYEESGAQLEESGRYFIDWGPRLISQKTQDEFISSLHLGKKQRCFFNEEAIMSITIFAGMIGLALITCFCAYLIIYNIMYLSVSGNIRYYGLLQTVGMTEKQIYRLILKQQFVIGAVGIVGGIVLGGLIGLLIMPKVVTVFGIQESDIQISFHPIIFLLTIVLTGFTNYVGSCKPAKIAVSISPIEATGYRPMNGKKMTRKTGRKKLLWRLAMEQLMKDKKKSIIVVLSLATSLSVFLCLVTLVGSHGAETVMSEYFDRDMIFLNDTLKTEEREDWAQLMDEDFLAKIQDRKDIQEVNLVQSGEIMVPWEPEFADVWMREQYEMWMPEPYEDILEEYKTHPENFGSFMVGISEEDFDRFNQTLEEPMDKEQFVKGKTCMLDERYLELTADDVQGEKITCVEYQDDQDTRTFEVAGLCDDRYYNAALPGLPPTVIVIDWVLEDFISETYVYRVGIHYDEEYDADTESAVLAAMQEHKRAKDFSYESKLELMETMKRAQGNMMEIGLGVVLILALIGMLNYVNTVTGNIQNRQNELAIMESVGMTEKQMNQMLMMEGMLFAGLSLMVTATVGLGITYGIYQYMNYQYISFTVPALPVLGMSVFIVGICVVIPTIVRRAFGKRGSIVERIIYLF